MGQQDSLIGPGSEGPAPGLAQPPPQLLVMMIAQPWQGSEMGSLCTGSLPASWHCLAPFAGQLSPLNAPITWATQGACISAGLSVSSLSSLGDERWGSSRRLWLQSGLVLLCSRLQSATALADIRVPREGEHAC